MNSEAPTLLNGRPHDPYDPFDPDQRARAPFGNGAPGYGPAGGPRGPAGSHYGEAGGPYPAQGGPYAGPNGPYGAPGYGAPGYGAPGYGPPGGPYAAPGGPYGAGVRDPHTPGDPFSDPFAENGPRRGGKKKKEKKHRLRRLWRLRTVKVATGVLAIFVVFVGFSAGQALAANNGQSASAKLAEWARDHYMGPLITFGEWLTYSPPKVGGKPSFSLAQGVNGKGQKFRKTRGFVPIIPKNLSSPAGSPLVGEGVWRLAETVKNEPAMYTTFLRPDSVHTSYVAGLVSMDQRLLSFSLHPGSEDPGPGNWNSSSYIAPGQRTGLMATFNSGFKLDASGGGFYLNGASKGSLVNGAATVVYYKNGSIKIGAWGRDFHMTSSIAGVRQNLKLIVDHGQIPADVSKNVLSSWGATLGGAYYVWRSGIGITKDGRVIYVYGPALTAQTLAQLLQRAGAVEGMQLDINPEWTTFESYHANGHPSNPAPQVLLPTQQSSAYRYYSVWSRDFTAVYAR
jgi:hypothetical protein